MKPISFSFVAAGIARNERAKLIKLSPSHVNKQVPSWSGSGDDLATSDLTIPVTDIDHWEDRYILTLIHLHDELGNAGKLTLNDATVSISRQKQIVKTSIAGVEGTIKEYIATGDFEIKITVGIVAVKDGVIVDDYPEEGLRVICKFLDSKEELRVQSVFFDIFDISHMIIKSYSVIQDTASNRQVINICAESCTSFLIRRDEL